MTASDILDIMMSGACYIIGISLILLGVIHILNVFRTERNLRFEKDRMAFQFELDLELMKAEEYERAQTEMRIASHQMNLEKRLMRETNDQLDKVIPL